MVHNPSTGEPSTPLTSPAGHATISLVIDRDADVGSAPGRELKQGTRSGRGCSPEDGGEIRVRNFVRALLAALGICSGCSKSPVLTPGQFTDECVQVLRAASPSLDVEVVKDLELRLTPPNGHEYASFLYNAYDTYRLDPTRKSEVIQTMATAILEMGTDGEAAIDQTRIVPVIKDRLWPQEAYQAMVSWGAEGGPDLYYEDFSRELIILYVQDSSTKMRYLRASALDEAQIERKALRALACANLKRLLPKIESHGANGIYVVTAGGTYEASLLLLDSLWDSGQFEVRGDIVVAIPTRDLLLVTGSEYPDGIRQVKQMVREAFAGGAYRLTQQLFVYRDGHFSEFDGAGEPNGPRLNR